METEVKDFVKSAIQQHEDKFHKRKCRSVFVEPTLGEIKAFFQERQINVSPEHFWNFYDNKKWKIGKNKMKDWRLAALNARDWENAPRNLYLKKEKTPEQLEKEKQDFERKRQEIREENSRFFKEKTTAELTEMLKDTKYLYRWWLIKEILEERKD